MKCQSTKVRISVEIFKNIVIAGMGGSALAADMVRVLTAGWLHIPLEVVKGYDLPGFVNEKRWLLWLVIRAIPRKL